MPRISAFYGIIITMYWELGAQHHTAHFHAKYGEYEASIAIHPMGVLAGNLPSKALAMVMEWAALHQSELEANWERVEQRDTPLPIEPLA